MKIDNDKGFTLIELLIVVAIIGVLSALLMTNFVGIRQRARDGQRKSDLRQIQSALELYRADVGSYPPDDGTLTTSLIINCGVTNVPLSNGSAVYMKIIPCDPLDTGILPFRYQYTSTGMTYCLRACLENTNDQQISNGSSCGDLNDCGGSAANYTLENP